MKREFKKSLVLVCAISSILTGCESMGGHLIQVDGTNVKKTRISGVPITINVPTANMFLVKRTTSTYQSGADTRVERRDELLTEAPIELGKTQVYSLDLKRPAAGTMDMTMDLAEQYPTKIAAKLDDKTIETVSKAITDQIANLSKLSQITGDGGGGSTPPAPPVPAAAMGGVGWVLVGESESVYAVIFDLASPTSAPTVSELLP